MKIEKYKGKYLGKHWFHHYYEVSQTSNNTIHHGLNNSPYNWGLGYYYHGKIKGFWLELKSWL